VTRADGQPLDYPYMTFEIKTISQRKAWFVIEDLRRPYTTLQEVVRSGNVKGAHDQFAVFRFAALTSPDLLDADAQRIVDDVEKKLETTLTTRNVATGAAIELPPLESLKPFTP
jgi:hypothetical protein